MSTPAEKRLQRSTDTIDAIADRKAIPDAVTLVCGASLKPEAPTWIWTYWLAQGKLHILAGAPGTGKTTIAMAFAATVTIGGRWPDGTRCAPGKVLIWTGEDDPADTLLPRLVAAGGDPSKVYFITGTVINGEPQPFDPARDMVMLAAQIEAVGGVSLLIVDPVVSAVEGSGNNNPEVRRSLQPLVDLALATRCAVLGITHFTKAGQGGDPTQRVVGSVAFAAVARIVMVAAKTRDEAGEPIRVLARSKSNVGPDEGGFQYHLEQIEPDELPGIEASRIAWGKSVEGSARELLVEPEADDEAGSAQDEAAAFLREALKNGLTPTKTLQAEAKDAGIAWRTVRRAADAIGIKRKKGGMNDGWYWSLPAEGGQKLPKVSTQNNGHLRENLDTFAADDPMESEF